MKRYHELARIMDKGEPVGYFIGDTHTLADPNSLKSIDTLTWIKVTPDRFKELVVSDQVQMLTMVENEIVCKLTQEELTAQMRMGINKKYTQQMEQFYWRDDITFSSEHIKLAEEGRALACSVSAIAKVVIAYFIPLIIYGTEKNVTSLLSRTEDLRKRGCVLKPGSSIKCTLLLPLIGRLPRDVSDILEMPMLFNTIPLEGSLNNTMDKVGAFTKIGGTSATEEALNFFKQQTFDNLKRLADVSSNLSANDFAETTNLFE